MHIVRSIDFFVFYCGYYGEPVGARANAVSPFSISLSMHELTFASHAREHGLRAIFTITAEILARSLANFYRQYAGRHMNSKFVRRVSERERAIRPFVIVKNKSIIDVSF